jgi:hypothetical protein
VSRRRPIADIGNPASANVWRRRHHADDPALSSVRHRGANDITPLPGTAGFITVLRSLPTGFLTEWSGKRDEARRERDRLRGQIVSTTQAGRQHECLLTAGQTAGGIKEILSVDEIMHKLVTEAEAALTRMRWRGEHAPPLRARLPSEERNPLNTGIMEEVPEPDSLGG